MKKIIFTLAAIMMVTMSSVSMASNKGGYNNGNHKGSHSEIRVEVYESYRNRDNNNNRYEESREYNNRDNRDYEEYDRNDCHNNKNRDRDYRNNNHCHKNNDSKKIVGTILGVASLIILATSH